MKDSLKDTQPAGALVGVARTRDQGKAVLTFIDAISEKSLRSTVTLTAARGRGKSAALGIAIAAAVAFGCVQALIGSTFYTHVRGVPNLCLCSVLMSHAYHTPLLSSSYWLLPATRTSL